MNEAIKDNNSAAYNVTDGERLNKSGEKQAEEKLFTQSELEKILEERLKRERKGQESLQKLKELIRFLEKKGILKSSSNSALAQELIFLIKQNIKDGKTKENPEEPEKTQNAENAENANPWLNAKAMDQKGRNSNLSEFENARSIIPDEARNSVSRVPDFPDTENIPQRGIEGNTLPDVRSEMFNKNEAAENPSLPGINTERHGMSEISEFLRKYGDKELSALMKSKAFISFCVGKRGSITQLYEQYISFLNELKSGSEAVKYRIAENSLASTGFSGANVSANNYSPVLSKRQMQIAKNAGMTYKEYAEMLEQIPNQKTGKKKFIG